MATPIGLLSARDVTAGYQDKVVIRNVSLDVSEGEVVGLLGANGAGKTTILNTLAGLITPKSGQVFLAGEEITGQRTSSNVRRGLTLVPQGGRSFPTLSVVENLEMGGFTINSRTLLAERVDMVLTLFPRLKQRLYTAAGSLSGGERQMLAIGRALMLQPKMVLLDEPFIGLSPVAIQEVLSRLSIAVSQSRCSVVIAEQNVAGAMSLATRAYVVKLGRVTEIHDRITSFAQVESLAKLYLG